MDYLKHTVENIEAIQPDPKGRIKAKFDTLAIPRGSLGRLEDLATIYYSIRGNLSCGIKHKKIFTLAGDHGVVAEGVSSFPQQVTCQMVQNFIHEGAAINVLARHIGAKVIVVDCGVAAEITPSKGLKIKKLNHGTNNMASGPAMSGEDAVKSIETGIELIEDELRDGLDIVGLGDMGIANTTPSSAIFSILGNVPVSVATGRGTGLNDDELQKKISVIEKAIAINRPDPNDPIDVLAKVGGYEIGGIAGLCLGAARHRIPIVLDGFISTAGAIIACALEPKVVNYLIASHVSAERGHKHMLTFLGKEPLFNLNMRLGEGTGATLGIHLVEAGVKLLNEMATFQDAKVSDPYA
ncbi:MAG: nicotinate-nucleotide--dimethylbenzimidazole phosphoribosyltransferase [Planctomycetes bacterium]|nr:nicotinate-nucleotide--dimethylbenzimidazole phosphoribosyltransferase [Planctomycetota bacterium]MBM4064394.1 nicotinate-nucleotide--dimethylbenzimidazole phosphoribosyltransferase [Planctomycetota bacterium]